MDLESQTRGSVRTCYHSKAVRLPLLPQTECDNSTNENNKDICVGEI